jgi:hypothetical protein
MDKKPFQFSIADLLLCTAIVLVWLVVGRYVLTNPRWGPPGAQLPIVVAIMIPLYQAMRKLRYGWAIAALAAPPLVVAGFFLGTFLLNA